MFGKSMLSWRFFEKKSMNMLNKADEEGDTDTGYNNEVWTVAKYARVKVTHVQLQTKEKCSLKLVEF